MRTSGQSHAVVHKQTGAALNVSMQIVTHHTKLIPSKQGILPLYLSFEAITYKALIDLLASLQTVPVKLNSQPSLAATSLSFL